MIDKGRMKREQGGNNYLEYSFSGMIICEYKVF